MTCRAFTAYGAIMAKDYDVELYKVRGRLCRIVVVATSYMWKALMSFAKACYRLGCLVTLYTHECLLFVGAY